MAKKTETVILHDAVGNYVTAFTPRLPPNSAPGAEKMYGIVLAWPKSEAKSALKEFGAAALRVAEAAWPGEGAKVLSRMKYPLSDDGDERYPENPSFKGKVFVHAKRKESFGPPGVVDAQVQTVMDPEEAYSGCVFRAQVVLYPFNHPVGGRGVGVGLSNLQVVRKGKRLDGRQAPEEAFAGYAEEPAEEPDDEQEQKPKGKKHPWE